jgi:membrane protein YqaA with SNARE-associated domain
MTVPRKLIIVFSFFYVAVFIYLFLFLTIPEIQNAIIQARKDIGQVTEGGNYIFALFISLFICFIGNASIGFPVPYPFVLFSFSNSIYLRFSSQGLLINEILLNPSFWLELVGLVLAGGLGSVLGELMGYLVGIGAKKIAEKKSSPTFENVQGFGKFVLEHPKSIYFYIFLAAALPIPDDPLWIALGMSKRKIHFGKCVFWGWLGKDITTLFYISLPILIVLGLNATGIEIGDISSVITESVMLLITISIMFFILSFNWDKYLEKRHEQKLNKQSNF